MNKTSVLYSGALLLASGAVLPTCVAAPLNLVQYPAGTASREPAPNVIVSVDDSGSMGNSGIATLKAALKQTFSTENLADGSIRLGWQSMNSNCDSIPGTSSSCNNNGLKVFKGSHRSNFLSWVDTLTPSGGTPSHRMVRNAGDYLKRTDLGKNSPWASEPGVTEAPLISCRRSYHIFMTDGAWNSGTSTVSAHVDADRNLAGYTAIEINGKGTGNLDNTAITLGDGKTVYNPNATTSRIYKDSWGFDTTTTTTRECDKNGRNCKDVTSTNYGLNTLSDLAFHYWATDLQPGMANDLKPLIKKSGDETFTSGTGSSKKSTTLSEFWNPKNDPATWQHMTTYTIGFGAGASAWSGSPKFGSDNYSGEFNALVTGDINWPSPLCGASNTGSGNNACDGSTGYSSTGKENGRRIELWHMALNGRGKFIPAPQADDLTKAFSEIVSNIIADTTSPITSFTSASSSVTRAGTSQYSSGYSADGWAGYIRSDSIAQNTASASANPAWGVKAGVAAPANAVTTADKLNSLNDISSRLILTTRNDTSAGVEFKWASLSSAQKALLKLNSSETDAVATNRLNFLRGDRSLENNPFRQRKSRQGDIVNSALWYVGPPVSNYSFAGYRAFARKQAARLPMVYVGGNDGMLHGFSALNGDEKIAYVPKGVMGNLKDLSLPSYTHRYYVDGSPFSGDVNWGTDKDPDWRSLLIGTLGAGGKGYFVLDITRPGSTTSTGATAVASNFSASNAASLAVMDKTAGAGDTSTGEAADIGHIFATPVTEDNNPQKSTQIARLNNGRWAAIMGNGYNSSNGRPVLLIQYLDGLKELKTLVAAAARVGSDGKNDGNGLSAPRLVDLNGDGTPDVVYAGDLHGNLWKFDISAADPSLWGVAFNGRPLYSAIYTANNVSSEQPITVAPVVKSNDRGSAGLMVAFGTGRNLTEGDRTDISVQTIYSILDSSRYKIVDGKVASDAETAEPVGTGWAQLVQQTVSSTAIAGSGKSAARSFWTVSQNNVNYSDTTIAKNKGWYLHLPVTGERLLDNLSFYDGSNLLEVLSEVPGSGSSLLEESCSPPATLPKLYRTFLNIMDGKKPSVQIIDVNGNGIYNSTDDSGASRMTASVKESKVSSRSKEIRTGSDGVVDQFNKLPEQPLRPSWRQLR